MLVTPSNHGTITKRVNALSADALFSLTDIDELLELRKGKARSHVGSDETFFPTKEKGSRNKKQYSIGVLKRYVLLLALTDGINDTFFKFPDAKKRIQSIGTDKAWEAFCESNIALLQLCLIASMPAQTNSANDQSDAPVVQTEPSANPSVSTGDVINISQSFRKRT
ncbi:hypothetical protein ACFQE0_23220 [Methylobacterium komagatae]|uniref:Uncharacterized protein n=1 Tax=Methylobacterium komagatae TaxID=374425 RepID=A0ABW2BSC9_9HYPH